MKTAVAIRHLAFEDLGTFYPALEAHGYACRYLDVGVDDLDQSEALEADLLIVLGGPIGAYEEDKYPSLHRELELIERRIALERPLLGLCLGAQLIARALGSNVFPTGIKEIGWGPIVLSEAAMATPLRHLAETEVLHWHGDSFDLPDDCDLLASTAVCRNQTFARGPNLLGLQFHPEVDAARIEQWLIGHACELASARIDPKTIRERSRSAGPPLRAAAERFLAEWLSGLD